MLIRIINGTYGYRPKLPNGKLSEYVKPVTRNDPPIDVSDEEASRLVGMNIAVYVDAPPPCALNEVATPSGAHADKKSIGNISADQMSQKSAGAALGRDGVSETDDEVPVYTTDMKADDLREAMKDLGLTIKSRMTKQEMVDALNSADALGAQVPEDVVE